MRDIIPAAEDNNNIEQIVQRPIIRRTNVRRPSVPAPEDVIEYMLNPEFVFFEELRDLILKSSPTEKEDMIDRLQKLGRIKVAIISGIFLPKERAEASGIDLLLVADDIDKKKLITFLKYLEAEVGKEISYALMDKEEFKYRLNMFDRFIRIVLDSPHEKLIDKLGIPE